MACELAIIGGGRMGEALAAGLLASGWAPPDALLIVEASPARRQELDAGLAVRCPGLAVGAELVGPVPGAVIAVKPADVEVACGAAGRAGVGRVLSVAAGVPLGRLESWVAAGARSRPTGEAARDGGSGDGAEPGAEPGPTDGSSGPSRHARRAPAAPGEGVAVLRAMPNTPALVGAGASALSAGAAAGPDDVAWASGILGAVGTVVDVAEHLLDAVTGVSGSGPAYVFLVAEALIDAGVLVGLPRNVARDLVVQTILGAARLLDETGQSPEELRAAVTSPAGTTAAGLRALEAAGVRAGLVDAVVAAAERSRQLGRPPA